MIVNEVKRFFENTDEQQNDFGWYEFTLEELGLPSTNKILEGIKKITCKKQINLTQKK